MNYEAIRKILAKGGESIGGMGAKAKGMAGEAFGSAKGAYGRAKDMGLGSTALVPSEFAGASDPSMKKKQLMALLAAIGLGGAGLGGAGYAMSEDEED